ncbi:regulatory protein RecX [Cellulosilyticum sp. I15G10I2]|uniref:regulatory protein RecX n=1 Tax=Cellulosilyticum sp. I15G10I2 TaxID=1892843 RepID=UPI00085C61FD|nr:RecX family transcriptional regulator [Cellulosilyticum sp. I15G10I2]
MKRITKISLQKTKGRYNLFLDELFFCGISEETLIKLELKKGMQVDEKELEAILKEESRNQCFNYCIKLLTRQNYFEKVLVDKLKQKEYSEEDIAYALEKLNTYHYIDDGRLAEAFVKDKKRFSKKGPAYIAQALRMKGIDRDTIAQTISENYSEEEELQNAKQLALKKVDAYRRKCADSYAIKNKMYGYLLQKGFRSAIISKVLDGILSEEDHFWEE